MLLVFICQILYPNIYFLQDEQIFRYTSFVVNIFPQVIHDWLIKMPTAWTGQERRGRANVPGLGVSARDQKERGGKRGSCFGVGGL